MKYILLITLFFISVPKVKAQFLTEFAKNEMKYWKLRGRFVGDDNNKDIYNGFTTVGSGDGMSVPGVMKIPNFGRSYNSYNPFVVNPGCELQKIDGIPTYANYDIQGNVTYGTPFIDPRDGRELFGILQFSDNSLVQLGNYIGILATEWALLSRENMSTYETERQLYYALKAIDRLDLKGETMYPGTVNSPSLNGFLMRNDVDEKFSLNTTGKNYDLVLSSKGCPPGLVSNQDCKSNLNNTSLMFGNAMSQDEVIGLLLGYGLIRKMMPFSATYNGVSLRQLSIEQTLRIVNYVKQGGLTNFWAIVDPDEGKRVCRGSSAILYSYGIAKAAEYITGFPMQNNWSSSIGALSWLVQKNMYTMNSLNTYVGFIMPQFMQNALGLDTYELLIIPGSNILNLGHDGAYTVSMFLKLATIGKSAQRPYPPFLDFTGKSTTNNISQTYLKQMYELLGSVISGYTPSTTESYWRNEFNKLDCSCNCLQGNNPISYYNCANFHSVINPPGNLSTPANSWAVEDRWAFHRLYGSYYSNTIIEFPGLDYMLAYNLYRYKYFAGGFSNRVRTYCYNKTFPYLSQPNQYNNNAQYWIGSTNYPFTAKAVFSISAYNSQVNSGTDIQFTAGSNVKLLSGFKAVPGSVFKANVREYDCNPSVIQVPNSSYVSWKNGDSLVNSSFDFIIDSTINIQLDEDSLSGSNEPEIDTSLFVIVYTNNIDTFIYDLHPDYVFSSDGEIIYAPQGNKAALQPATIKSVNLYPNPTNGLCYLEYMLYYNADIRIRVYNQLGQYFSGITDQEYYSQEKGTQKITLNTSSLAPGIYYCEFSIDGLRETKKFTVVK